MKNRIDIRKYIAATLASALIFTQVFSCTVYASTVSVNEGSGSEEGISAIAGAKNDAPGETEEQDSIGAESGTDITGIDTSNTSDTGTSGTPADSADDTNAVPDSNSTSDNSASDNSTSDSSTSDNSASDGITTDAEVSQNGVSVNKTSDVKDSGRTLSGNTTSGNTASGNTVSSDSISVNEVENVSVEDRFIVLEEKKSEEETIEQLPETWTVTLEDGSEKDVDVKWECLDDYDEDQYTSFVFQGTIDDEEVSPSIDEESEERLTMEVCFESEKKSLEEVAEAEGQDGEEYGIEDASDLAISICMLSPNTIMPEIETEQGTDQVSEAFLDDYGSNADSVIETSVSYRGSNSVLSSTAYDTFKAMSPSSGDYMYSRLSTAQRSLYDKLDSWVTQYLYYGKEPTRLNSGQPMTAFISGSDLTRSEAINVCELYFFNNPQAFFLTSQYYAASGTNGAGYSVAVAFIPGAATPSSRCSVAETIAQNFNTTYSAVALGNDDYQRAKRAHDAVCERISYDSYANSSQSWTDFVPGNVYYDQTIMSVFYGGTRKSVCAGYSKANTALLRKAGIAAFSITSNSHEWNKVYLYGQWYCVDVTWDDMETPYTREYFLKSDATLRSGNGSHYWESRWTGIAPASPSDYSTASRVYSITYNLNGGTNNSMNPSGYTADSGTITLAAPSRSGYTFGGWYTDAAFTSRITTIKGSDARNYVLYAKWTANQSSNSNSSSNSNTSSNSNSSTNSGTDPVGAFVTRLYRVVLGREPDAGGYAWWVAQLKSGAKSGSEVVSGFYLSEEMYQRNYSNSYFVELAYKGIMGRGSDANGKAYWVDLLDGGVSYQYVVCGFVDSNEFSILCDQYGIRKGSISVTEDRDRNSGVTKYVSRLYTKALGRAYDTGGLNYWCRVINSDKSRANVINVALNGFLHSEEFYIKNPDNAEYVRIMYRTFLNREPDPQGFSYWLATLNVGTSRDDVARGFAYSDEFSTIMAAYGL